MRLEILQVPGCPHAALLRQRLTEALTTSDAQVAITVISDHHEAAAAGMTGSPTLLIDGVDRFAEPGRDPGVSCRLYQDDDGRSAAVPSVAALRRVLHEQHDISSLPEDGTT